MTTKARSRSGFDGRRIAMVGFLGIFLIYALCTATGYLWVYYGLKNHRIGFSQVAFFRWREIRHDMAAQQFSQAQAAWEEKKYQVAYLGFSSAVRNDPDNVEGRLTAARFFTAVGVPKVALGLLEEGLKRAPDDRRLIDRTFDLLAATGGDAHALDLLHGEFAPRLRGPNGTVLRTHELLATLNARGAEAAASLLGQYPDLREAPASAPVVARVLWASGRSFEAIGLLSGYVRGRPDDFPSYARLATWQSMAGLPDDAVQSAEQACARFPHDPAPRVLLIEQLAGVAGAGSSAWQKGVSSYLRDFDGRPEAVVLLAELAGQKGWVGLARVLYGVGAVDGQNLAVLAIYYSDALTQSHRLEQAREVLTEIAAQVPEENSRFMVLLRNRQVAVAAALGDHDAVREFARRLAAALGSNTEEIEATRRRFVQMQVPEAAAELAVAEAAGGK